MKRLYSIGAIALLFIVNPFISFSQQPTTVVNSSNCNFAYTFNITDEGFSSPSIYSDANDFGLFWNGANLSETIGANFNSRTASTISGIFLNTESLRTVVGFDYTVPAGTEYRIRIISGQFNAPLEILASTSNGPIWSAFPSTAGSLCLELQDNDLPVGVQIRYEITFRTINPGAIVIDNFRRASQNIPLPVTFLGFIAREINGSYKLLWNVGEEINVRGYEVESSNDGVTFTKIGYVPATGESNYSFLNNQVIKGTQFFRVRNIDLDNQYKYTGIIRIQNDKEDVAEIKLYPVPASNILYVEHRKEPTSANITVVNMNGKILIRTNSQPGSYQTSVYVNDLPAGIYIIKYDDGNGTIQTQRFIRN
jgi:hypothetical protein